MVALPQVYRTADLPDSGGGIVHIPDGKYVAVIVKTDLKPTKDGTGQFLEVTHVITQGAHANTELIERLNIVNNNQTAVEIAYKKLARISEAVGMQTTPKDSNELHNKPLLLTVKTEAGKPYKDSNGIERTGKDKSIIDRWEPLTQGTTQASSPPAFVSAGPAASTPAPATPPWAAR